MNIKNGLDWLVITAIPASASMTGIFDNMKLMFILMIAAILLSSAIYFKLTNKLLRPIDNLIAITEKFFARGSVSKSSARQKR